MYNQLRLTSSPQYKFMIDVLPFSMLPQTRNRYRQCVRQHYFALDLDNLECQDSLIKMAQNARIFRVISLFIKHGLKLNLEKTEVMHIGHQKEELVIEMEGKKLTQRDSFVYLGGAVCGDGKTEREVRRRVQAGANAWRAVEG